MLTVTPGLRRTSDADSDSWGRRRPLVLTVTTGADEDLYGPA